MFAFSASSFGTCNLPTADVVTRCTSGTATVVLTGSSYASLPTVSEATTVVIGTSVLALLQRSRTACDSLCGKPLSAFMTVVPTNKWSQPFSEPLLLSPNCLGSSADMYVWELQDCTSDGGRLPYSAPYSVQQELWALLHLHGQATWHTVYT